MPEETGKAAQSLDDLIERLRAVSDLSDWANLGWDIPGSATAKLRDMAREAADEIARLRAELAATQYEMQIADDLCNGEMLRAERAEAALDALRADAERYRLVRRGQHWSVINGIGDEL